MERVSCKGDRLMGWKITYLGQEVTDDDATVGEATTVSQIVGRVGWEVLDPGSAPDVLGAWCVIAAMRTGKTMQDAVLVINQTPMRHLASSFEQTTPDVPVTNGDVDLATVEANLSAMQAVAARLREQRGE